MRFFTATAKPILADLSGTLVFYLLYMVTGSAQLGALVGLALGLAQLLNELARGRRPASLLLVSLTLTAVLGGLTFITDDPRFMLVKPGIICAALGLTMLPRGWLTAYVPPIARELLSDTTFDRVGWSWAALMFVSAALNLAAVALMPPRAAALAFTLWAVGSKVLLFAVQYGVLRVRAGRIYRRRDAEGTLSPAARAMVEAV